MGLFKSAEEKAEAKQKKLEKALRKYGLDNLTDQDDLDSVARIMDALIGANFGEISVAFGANERQILSLQSQYQHAILEQNFIIIRQLDRICSAFYDR